VRSRRAMLGGGLAAFVTYALLREARALAGALDGGLDGRLDAQRWIARQDELARALADGTLSQTAWHDELARLARAVEVEQLLAEIGRARVTDAGAPFMRDPQKRDVAFRDAAGRKRKLGYVAALFAFTRDNVITPHGHRHMASAHMVLQGSVRIRSFDRVADKDDALIIRPTGDRVAAVGETAAMTEARDNIHWFAPRSETALTFDVIVPLGGPDAARVVIQPVDPLGGETLPDGTIRAPVLSFAESMRRYSAAL
jgi:hypothetical protein